MLAATDVESPADKTGNEKEPELPAQPRTGSVTVVDIAASSSQETSNSGWRFYTSCISLGLITVAVALDATSLSVALPVRSPLQYPILSDVYCSRYCQKSLAILHPTCIHSADFSDQIISHSLHGTAIAAFWCGTAFLLSSTVFQPTFSSFSNIFGRKLPLLVALVFFTVGAIVGALAQNLTTLIIGRTIQGVGGGGIISLSEILITDLVPLRNRGNWFGFQSLIWAIGSVTGPLIGGAFAQDATWRWIFWINLPFCGLGFLTLPYCLQLHHPPGPLASKLQRFDWFGAFLLTASTTSFLMPVSWGGVMFPWSSFRTLVPLLLGIFGLVVFGLYEAYVTKTPLIPLQIFGNRTAAVNYIGTLVQGTILWCLLYYLPFYYEAVKGYNPIIVGVACFPETFTVAPASIFVGIVVGITGRFRWAIWSGWTLTVLGMGLLYLLSPGTSIPAFVFLNIVPGLGLGLLFSCINLALQAAATEQLAGYAAAMYIFMRSLGQGIGVAVGGVVFQSRFAVELRGYPDLATNATALAQDASGLVQVIKAMPKGATERTVIVNVYADALKVVWAVMAGLAFVALILSLGTKGLSLNAEMETEQAIRKPDHNQYSE